MTSQHTPDRVQETGMEGDRDAMISHASGTNLEGGDNSRNALRESLGGAGPNGQSQSVLNPTLGSKSAFSNIKSHDVLHTRPGSVAQSVGGSLVEPSYAEVFDEFLAQVSFKRTTEIGGYSSTRIQFTFVPFKLTTIHHNFTLFMENQDYTKPIPISISGRCVDVPIYVEKEEYNLNLLVYEQFYREKIILYNRGANAMKISLTFPKDFKPYLEFNPTLGFIQGHGSFEIWAKLKPDRTILHTCSRYLVKQDEEPAKDPYEEFTMRIPVKVTGANQVLPVKFSLLCVFTVQAVSFMPMQLDFGSIFS